MRLDQDERRMLEDGTIARVDGAFLRPVTQWGEILSGMSPVDAATRIFGDLNCFVPDHGWKAAPARIGRRVAVGACLTSVCQSPTSSGGMKMKTIRLTPYEAFELYRCYVKGRPSKTAKKLTHQLSEARFQKEPSLDLTAAQLWYLRGCLEVGADTLLSGVGHWGGKGPISNNLWDALERKLAD